MELDLSNKNLSIKRATKHVHQPGYKFPVEKRIEVVTKYLALGNMRLVSELTGVSYQLCRQWKTAPWWKELEDEIRAARTLELDNKLAKIVDKSLDTIADRLENGDVVFDQKSGTVVRKEVSLKDATKVATDLMTRQAVLQKQEKEVVAVQNTSTIQDQLRMLAMEFAKFNKTNTGPVEDAKIIQEPVDDISLEQGASLGFEDSMVFQTGEETSWDFEAGETTSNSGNDKGRTTVSPGQS